MDFDSWHSLCNSFHGLKRKLKLEVTRTITKRRYAMATKKILFPTDFSTAADAGLPEAATLARERGAVLVILHVQEPPAAYAEAGLYYGVPEPDDEALMKMLREIVPPGHGVPCEHRLVMGDPASEIVRVARKENVDMIVMGTHGRSGFGRLILGSVAESVMRKAPCPVLTYKLSQKTAAPAL
jgi:nucleotide-binding universal stress UspA family protein